MVGRDGCLPSCPGWSQPSRHRGRHGTAAPLPEHRLEACKRAICFLELLQVLPKTQELCLVVTPMCWARRWDLTATLGRILTAGCSGPQVGTVMHDVGQLITLQRVHAEGVRLWDGGPCSATWLGGLCSAKPSPGHFHAIPHPSSGRQGDGNSRPRNVGGLEGKNHPAERDNPPSHGQTVPTDPGSSGRCLMPRLVDSAGVGGTCTAKVHPKQILLSIPNRLALMTAAIQLLISSFHIS